jgi:hypothetical protein
MVVKGGKKEKALVKNNPHLNDDHTEAETLGVSERFVSNSY